MRSIAFTTPFTPLFAALSLVATPALAEEQSRPESPGRPSASGAAGKWSPDRITVGLGGGIGPDYAGSNDYKFQPGGIVQGSVSGFNFAMRGTNLYVDLAREARGSEFDLIAGPVMQVRLDRNGTIKDTRVAALGKRNAALELGGNFGIGKRGVLSRFDEVSLEVSVVKDVGTVHKSHVIRPSLGYQTLLGKRTFALARVSAEVVGAGFARTYYDVPAGTVLPAYSTGGGGLESVGASALISHGLGRNPSLGLSVFALTGYSRITGKFARSPIVAIAGSPNQARMVVGLGYTF